jgi:hypothetical protein
MMEWDGTSGVKAALISRLSRYNAFLTEASLARLYQAVLDGYAEIRRKGEWAWKNQTDTLTTTSGNKGPYNPPAGFYRFALKRQIYRYAFTDAEGVVLAPIRESETQSWDLLYRVEDGKLYFREDPGDQTLTLNFQGEVDPAPTEQNARAAVESMPGNLYQPLAEFVEGAFLRDSPDTRSEGLELMKLADIHLSQEWEEYDKGRNRQRQRAIRGMDGRPIDGLGQAHSIHGGPRGVWPRGFGRGRR